MNQLSPPDGAYALSRLIGGLIKMILALYKLPLQFNAVLGQVSKCEPY